MKHTITPLSLLLPATVAACLTLLPAACTQDDISATGADEAASGVPLQITSIGLQQASGQTRAATPLNTGEIGVYRFNPKGIDTYREMLNVHYFYTPEKGWQPDKTDNTVYLLKETTDVVVYYPYSADRNNADYGIFELTAGKYTGRLNDPTRHDPNDLCYAVVPMNNTDPARAFELKHAMAMVECYFAQDAALYGPLGCRLTSVGIANAGVGDRGRLYYLENPVRVVTSHNTVTWEENLLINNKTLNESAPKAVALLVPCTLEGDVLKFYFKIDGMDASVPVRVDGKLSAFEAGKIYQFYFTLSGNYVLLDKVSIKDWQNWVGTAKPQPADYVEMGGAKWAKGDLMYDETNQRYYIAADAKASFTLWYWNSLIPKVNNSEALPYSKERDPCTQVEPKGYWVTPSEAQFEELMKLESAGSPDGSDNATWIGTTEFARAEASPEKYLCFPASVYYPGESTLPLGQVKIYTIVMGHMYSQEVSVMTFGSLSIRCVRQEP